MKNLILSVLIILSTILPAKATQPAYALSLSGSVNPMIVAVNAAKNVLYFKNTPPIGIYQKQDNGNSTNWLQIASGPTSSLRAGAARYIDLVIGDDSGDGSDTHPWKTLQHAYNVVTDASITNQYIFYILGGTGSDTDSNPITGKPNISLIGETQAVQIQGVTITGGTTNDIIEISNLTMTGNFTWQRNDASAPNLYLNNVLLYDTLGVGNAGSGRFTMTISTSIFTGNAIIQAALVTAIGASFFGPVNFLNNASPIAMDFFGGYFGAPVTITGGQGIQLAGQLCDTGAGCSFTAVHGANGDPFIQGDSGSLPASITGVATLVLQSLAQNNGYTPANPLHWSSVPANVSAGLDKAKILSQSAIGTQPACSLANSGVSWLVKGTTGVADIYQVCQKNAADAYVWATH